MLIIPHLPIRMWRYKKPNQTNKIQEKGLWVTMVINTKSYEFLFALIEWNILWLLFCAVETRPPISCFDSTQLCVAISSSMFFPLFLEFLLSLNKTTLIIMRPQSKPCYFSFSFCPPHNPAIKLFSSFIILLFIIEMVFELPKVTKGITKT